MDNRGTRQVTLAEVARAAGVSPATASRVLSGGDRVVRRDLREQVVEAARRLRYVPNAHAQALAGGTTTTVGLIMHDVADPYFAAITRGAMPVALRHGALVLLGSTLRSITAEIDYVTTFRAQRAHALLLIGSGFADDGYRSVMGDELARHRAAGGRHAFVSEHHLPGATVLPDNAGGAAALAQALVRLGHRRFAVAGGPAVLTTVADRITGFVDALEACGIARSEVLLVERDFHEEGGRAAVADLLTRGPDVTALFCVSDAMAVGALTELRSRGVRVPDDLSLVGFGDVPIARHLSPALSTARLDLEGMGRAAMEMVLDDDADVGDRTVPFPAEVVLRESTGPRA